MKKIEHTRSLRNRKAISIISGSKMKLLINNWLNKDAANLHLIKGKVIADMSSWVESETGKTIKHYSGYFSTFLNNNKNICNYWFHILRLFFRKFLTNQTKIQRLTKTYFSQLTILIGSRKPNLIGITK